MLETNSPYDLASSTVFRVGRVVSVEGRRIVVSVDKTKNGSHLLFRGNVIKNTSVGGYVKIAKGFSEIIAKVDGESVGAERSYVPGYQSKRDRVRRELQVSIVGFFDRYGEFNRGVQELPLLDNECFILTRRELELVHHFVSKDDHSLAIGTLPMERNQPISIGVNSTFASHIGIFGNTGSGKSYTLAKLYHELFKVFGEKPGFRKNAKFVLMDFNGEYVDLPADQGNRTSTSIITTDKSEYKLVTGADGGDKIPLPKAAIEDPEVWAVLLDATEKTQAPFLARALNSSYLDERLESDEKITELIAQRVWDAIKVSGQPQDKAHIDRFLTEVSLTLDEETRPQLDELARHFRSRLNYHFTAKTFTYINDEKETKWANGVDDNPAFEDLRANIATMPLRFDLDRDTRRIRLKIVFQYYFEVFNGYANQEHLGPLMKRLETRVKSIDRVIEVSDDVLTEKPLTVVSLRDANLETKKWVPLLLCKYLYGLRKESSRSKGYLNFIIDEAHTVLSTSSTRESETWKDYRLETFEEIIKEGRKFGVFLTIASQRPYDISPTIVSQLHNYFLHRLVNDLDINSIQNAVSYLDKVSSEQIPILPTGHCVISGVSTTVPVVACISPLQRQFEPNNKTAELTKNWFETD